MADKQNEEKKNEIKNVIYKALAVIAIVLILVFILAVTFNSELRSYLMFKIAPDYAKQVHFLKFRNMGSQEIYLLGTIHSDHLTSEEYSLLHIQSVIENLRPSLLLIESRPEELSKGNLADGPVEMLFANLTAKSLRLKVDGMDWWQKGVSGSNDLREDKMFKNILSKIKGEKKVLILTGFSHVAEFSERFEEKSFWPEDDFSSYEKQKLFDISEKELVLPPEMASYIQKRIDLETEELKNTQEEDIKKTIEESIEIRKENLELINRAYVESREESKI